MLAKRLTKSSYNRSGLLKVLEIHEDQQQSMKINEDLIKLIKIYENHGNPWKSVRVGEARIDWFESCWDVPDGYIRASPTRSHKGHRVGEARIYPLWSWWNPCTEPNSVLGKFTFIIIFVSLWKGSQYRIFFCWSIFPLAAAPVWLTIPIWAPHIRMVNRTEPCTEPNGVLEKFNTFFCFFIKRISILDFSLLEPPSLYD